MKNVANRVIELVRTGIEATILLAGRLASQSAPVDCITLRGDLGAGKTAFSRAFIQTLCGAEIEVTSPTFTLVQDYDVGDGGKLWHFDLYRLKAEGEVEELGLDDALQAGRVLIEWPEKVERRLPPDRLEIAIEFGAEDEDRRFTLSPHGVWKDKLIQLNFS